MLLRGCPMFLTGFRSFSRKHGRIPKGALKRSLNTNLREESLGKLGLPSKNLDRLAHVILTLDSNKFAEKKQQRLNIGNLKCFFPNISLLKELRPVKSTRITYDRTRKPGKKVLLPCPPDTKAFLYYYLSPGRPRIAGELRLRVASSDDSASFESGSDLLQTDGQIWSRPVYAVSKFYKPLYEKLREEGYVPDDLHAVLSTLPPKKLGYRRSHFLYTLNDTFILDFSELGPFFFVITEKGVERLPLPRLFSHGRQGSERTPYTGSALARFECSTLPQHNGTRTILLRFLKIITPVKCVIPLYDGYIAFPEEGELYRRARYPFKLDHQPVWSGNIDGKLMFRSFQLLWNTST